MTTIITLLTLALLLFFLEIFVPGGFLVMIGGVLIIAASVVAYNEFGWLPAVLLFILAGVGAMLMFFVEVKLLTKTPLGKRIQLTNRIEGASLKEVDVKPLLDQIGMTITPLNPSGRIKVSGQLIEAVSDVGWIPKGQQVKVVGSDVFHVRVRIFEAPESTTEEIKI
jgi:membrane-bound serine protease (ClpP class)